MLLAKGEQIDFDKEYIHTVAGFVKAFLRELPSPLLSFELYDDWLLCGERIYISNVYHNL